MYLHVHSEPNLCSRSGSGHFRSICIVPSSKEMANILLDQDSKAKCKAAVDVVGNPLGKCGGTLMQQLLIFGISSLAAMMPWLAGIPGILLFVWYNAVNSLDGQFEDNMEGSGDTA